MLMRSFPLALVLGVGLVLVHQSTSVVPLMMLMRRPWAPQICQLTCVALLMKVRPCDDSSVTLTVLRRAMAFHLVKLLVLVMNVLEMLGSLRLLQMGLLSTEVFSFTACFTHSHMSMRLILSMHVAAALVFRMWRFPLGDSSLFCMVLFLPPLVIFLF